MPDINTLKQMRLPILEKREANRKGKNDPKVEESCNAELRKLNLAIQGVAPYPEKKKAPAKKAPAKKKSEPDPLA